MRVLILGKDGQLGKSLLKYVPKEIIYSFYSKNELDISNFDAVEEIINNFIPDIIINAAAYTNVEKAENDEVNLHNANVLGPYNLAYLSKKYKKKLIHISTDYIFDGQKKFPYVEEDDAKPLSKYGKSKLEGEKKNYFII